MNADEAFMAAEQGRQRRQLQNVEYIAHCIETESRSGNTHLRALDEWVKDGSLDIFLTENPTFGLTCGCTFRNFLHRWLCGGSKYITWDKKSGH